MSEDIKKPVKHRELNQRQKVVVREMIKTNGNKTQSLINAGYSKNYAEKRGHNMLEKDGIKQEYERKFLKVLKEKGVDDNKLGQVLVEGLNAEKVFTFQGEVIKPENPVPDHFIRERFIQDILKVRGDFAPEQHEHSLKQENAEEAFRQRIQRRRELEAKASGDSDEKPLERPPFDTSLSPKLGDAVDAEVVDEGAKETENKSEVTHKKGSVNETV